MIEKVHLEELYDIGSSKRVFQSEWRDRGIPFYRAREIAKLAADGYVNNELFIDEELYKEYIGKYGKPKSGDIMVTGVGTLGVCYIVKDNDEFYFKDGNILWFRQKAKNKVISEYVVKAFTSKAIKEQIQKNSSGTTVGTFTIQTAKKVELELPSVEEQSKIVSILGRLEKIIDRRKDQLNSLDNLIKSRFVEMFGDPKTNPMKWQEGTIRDIVTEVKYGTSKPAVEGGKYKYIRMNNITYNGELDLSDLKHIDIQEKEVEKCIVRKGDVLFNRTNSKELVGKTCVFNQEEAMVIAGYIIRVRMNEKAVPEYLAAVLNSKYGKETLFGMCKAIVGQANINAQELQNIKIVIPPVDLQQKFVELKQRIDKLKFTI